MAIAINWLSAVRARAGDHVDYRYEFYGEEDGRMQINTHSVLFEKQLIESVTAKGGLIYDGISGASPNGSPPHGNSQQVPLTKLTDIRRAGNVEIDLRQGIQTLSPQVSYSKESDYESTGIALNDALEFNQKNTTLRLGAAHNFDRVLDTGSPRKYQPKETTDGLVGFSQLLDPKTIVAADFTFGYDSGYLTDPYRRVLFRGWLTAIPGVPLYITYPEVRPSHRSKEVLQTSLLHFFDRLNGSGEFTYRFYHDSYDVYAHTAALAWHQRLGGHLILAPAFRVYEQSTASFYTPQGVPGLSPIDGDRTRPKYYSADYRLSHMLTLTYGLKVTIIVADWLYLDVGFHRYEMYGLDSITSPSAYPKANIVTAGLRLLF